MGQVLIAVANGIEEMETVIISDLLVRAGVDVVLAMVPSDNHNTEQNHRHKQGRKQDLKQEQELNNGLVVTASRGLSFSANRLLGDVAHEEFDAIICPGGLPGAQDLAASAILKELLLKQHQQQKLIAAICASPALVLAHHGLLDNVDATGYPSTEEHIPSYVNEAVVVSDHIITSQGPGTAMAFSLAVIESLLGDITAKEVAATALIPYFK